MASSSAAPLCGGAVLAAAAPRKSPALSSCAAILRPPCLASSSIAAESSLFRRVCGLGVAKSPSRRLLSTSCKLSQGDVLPSFNLKDQEGRVVNSSKFKNKPVVLYFYPADESPGCTKEACAFRDSYDKFRKAGAEVIGISADTPESHKAFAKKYRLPFTLLTDEGNKLRKDWGIPGDFFGSLPGRQTYVIDKKGVVRLVFNNQFQPEKHAMETLKVLESM
ncbi:peroxiredoxin Q, chloroplastic [Selaginella moellendorffii]|uniref:peroxiredoxin Q, chloroplastic n=1 Tax=Selaginella moellendorffii TaxID=88036 RepID=UPI000D1C8F22|nr:peroxiredoxin Q, chloroplastic [Selaginella moellendorffii]|eukprot:XP_002973213.2 peroxiredoxin Q, chloroplastic [Selaginella moellendorffii]